MAHGTIIGIEETGDRSAVALTFLPSRATPTSSAPSPSPGGGSAMAR